MGLVLSMKPKGFIFKELVSSEATFYEQLSAVLVAEEWTPIGGVQLLPNGNRFIALVKEDESKQNGEFSIVGTTLDDQDDDD